MKMLWWIVCRIIRIVIKRLKNNETRRVTSVVKTIEVVRETRQRWDDHDLPMNSKKD